MQIEKALIKFVDVCPFLFFFFFYCYGTENLNQDYAAWTYSKVRISSKALSIVV